MIDYSKLNGVIPDKVYTELLDCCTRFRIASPLRLAHFLAQCAHESANFTRTEENLNYSAEGLLKTFKKYFNEESAHYYARNPVAIASLVYANRNGNADEESQEGWLYRGFGYIQLSGKANAAAFDKIVPENILMLPELIATKYPLLSAGWYWDSRRANDTADKGFSEQDIANVTKKVNGGMNGLHERIVWFNKFYNLLK